jgi:hypothetical protein
VRWLATEEADKSRGSWIDPALGRTTFEAWSAEWLEFAVKLKPKTRAGYRGILETHLLPAFGPWELAEIQPIDAARFVTELSGAGAAPRTVRNVYRVFSGIMRAAVVNRRIGYSPCVGVDLPKAERREMRFPAHRELLSLGESVREATAP